jgi:predicted nucleic acid-binding protein
VAIVYFDSSAFVKLVVDEAESDLAAALWDGCDAAVSSRLAYPEVRAALAAGGRAGRLAQDEQPHAESLWEDFWAATRPVEV